MSSVVGARAIAADDLPVGEPVEDGVRGRSLDLVRNSIALIVAKVAIMAMGFVFWLIAARAFEPRVVGLAAGAVAAVMLCTQLALLGVGSSFIAHLPMRRSSPTSLVNTSTNIVLIASASAGVVFLLFSALFLHRFATLVRDPLFDAAFVVVAIVGTLGILLDQISTAFRRGDQAVTRNVLSGGVTLGHLVLLALVVGEGSANALFATWVTGGIAQVALGYAQLRRSMPAYRYRPTLDRSLTRPLVRVGIPNHLLTLSERVPGFILPIAVTELLSPAQNAHWYTAWMMAWVVYIVPIQVGITLFAEAADDPGALASHVRRGISTSLALGVAGAVAAAVLAPVALGFLGHAYAAEGTTPLRILVVAVVPLTLIQAYFATCRATGRLREALIVAGVASIGGTVAAAAVGAATGLVGMATAWVVTQTCACIWAMVRLHSLMPSTDLRPEPADEPGATPLAAPTLDP